MSWYVPDRALPVGDYWWRVVLVTADGEWGAWSETRRFTIVDPPAHNIPLGTSMEDVRRIIDEAAQNAPARVVFEPGTYHLLVTVNGEVLETREMVFEREAGPALNE